MTSTTSPRQKNLMIMRPSLRRLFVASAFSLRSPLTRVQAKPKAAPKPAKQPKAAPKAKPVKKKVLKDIDDNADTSMMDVDAGQDESDDDRLAPLKPAEPAKAGKKKTASETYTKVFTLFMSGPLQSLMPCSYHNSNTSSNDRIRTSAASRPLPSQCGSSTQQRRGWFSGRQSTFPGSSRLWTRFLSTLLITRYA